MLVVALTTHHLVSCKVAKTRSRKPVVNENEQVDQAQVDQSKDVQNGAQNEQPTKPRKNSREQCQGNEIPSAGSHAHLNNDEDFNKLMKLQDEAQTLCEKCCKKVGLNWAAVPVQGDLSRMLCECGEPIHGEEYMYMDEQEEFDELLAQL